MEIAIIGAGPRGLMTLERLTAWQQRDRFPLRVTLYDPAGIGGMVWQPEQPLSLIMNTIPIQITLFTDATVALSGGPLTTGPNLYQWSKQIAPTWLRRQPWSTAAALRTEANKLQERGYSSRALYGAYTRWFFDYVQQHATGTDIAFSPTTVTGLHWLNDTTVQLTAGDQQTTVNGVVMALGYSENDLTEEQEDLRSHAQRYGLTYIPQRNPADAAPALAAVQPTDRVILRGLGLSFFDYVSLLTEGRGGTYTRGPQHTLIYHASGQEPPIYASSRGGFPYRAKGFNEKGDGVEVPPRFLTKERLAQWHKAGHVSGLTFWHLLQAEVEFVYYMKLVRDYFPTIDAEALKAAMISSGHPTKTANSFGVPASQVWNWQVLAHPEKLTDEAGFDTFVLQYLHRDYMEARRGTETGPFTSALEVFRDMRDPIRQVVENRLLTDGDYWNIFLKEFQPINDFLSIGPPAKRIQELTALVQAGIVKLVGPQMALDMPAHAFAVRSQMYPSRRFLGNVLIEARLPAVNYPTATNPLLRDLDRQQLLRPYTLELPNHSQPLGAITVDRRTSALITAAGDHLPNVALYGIPTEGLHWLTTASPRPDVNDVSLRETDALVASLLHHLAPSQD
ncbi:FAD/NAD(P)-binding protein [Schleiferilactobacillus shenzhenensis]|uniref:FAD-dependent urate hydroxylase HpyO/Asp monooxygenase CreE-like FAD/NAD(P)-binding domain-containing protein n=1 Tax=Schleiferilactobacillus shenzhenensis LY-73 TaxID=1231336 RepID=U4TSA3_9LACO|nr:FAD/NAD(P)-binding protein [Schleiferilactobacillus shenzhenensis]ERL64357.1 hypothetical protein L248_1019 [Schleiferilactobacillus shenzhenensis LY-73]